ncbi:hypothetical protein [Haloarcula nitratireducens]|uniref:Uncharacterized protein n=1 Tax=Haloarcula nitratireducens TaxID=2487749 RepID=A0AAW4PCT8_9EURY|nr:hypothetical protein [Halomicroarcula nitratireducens]MBX0295734.1 hypothetical protein [Halomicroarcula nitratireducens]
MRDANRTERSNREYGGDNHIEGEELRGKASSFSARSTRFRHAASEHPVELAVRLVAGITGILLITIAIERVTQPALAYDLLVLLQSPTGQWLTVMVFALVLLSCAVRSGMP